MSASGACGTGSSFSNSRSKKSERAAEQDRSEVAQERDEWRASQSELNSERLVFIDETGAATDPISWLHRSLALQRCCGLSPSSRTVQPLVFTYSSNSSTTGNETEVARLARELSSLAHALHGIDAKRGVLVAASVFQIDGRLREHVTNHGALFAPLLYRVHIRELKYDDAVGRLGAAQA